ncbi:ATP-binding cassette domain-containing protein [Nocardioides sambongensis]|uniref:ATP-binding cassette domain-containing protein n=1 Tax=Nocardioides sambongensis TaxID=2589074 RepID=UPI0022ABAD1A|nr:ATP-binding cassette domain-containing protein [Nocardioides sambongensis]
MTSLTVHGLGVSYGPVRALDGVGFEVPGGITAVLGANGAGKTTLLRTLSGLVAPTAGTARLDDIDLLRTPAEEMTRVGLAHVPRDAA